MKVESKKVHIGRCLGSLVIIDCADLVTAVWNVKAMIKSPYTSIKYGILKNTGIRCVVKYKRIQLSARRIFPITINGRNFPKRPWVLSIM